MDFFIGLIGNVVLHWDTNMGHLTQLTCCFYRSLCQYCLISEHKISWYIIYLDKMIFTFESLLLHCTKKNVILNLIKAQSSQHKELCLCIHTKGHSISVCMPSQPQTYTYEDLHDCANVFKITEHMCFLLECWKASLKCYWVPGGLARPGFSWWAICPIRQHIVRAVHNEQPTCAVMQMSTDYFSTKHVALRY